MDLTGVKAGFSPPISVLGGLKPARYRVRSTWTLQVFRRALARPPVLGRAKARLIQGKIHVDLTWMNTLVGRWPTRDN